MNLCWVNQVNHINCILVSETGIHLHFICRMLIVILERNVWLKLTLVQAWWKQGHTNAKVSSTIIVMCQYFLITKKTLKFIYFENLSFFLCGHALTFRL